MRKKSILISIGMAAISLMFILTSNILNTDLNNVPQNAVIPENQNTLSKTKSSNITNETIYENARFGVIKSFIVETDVLHPDKVIPEIIYLNNTVNVVQWTNLTNSTYIISIGNPDETRDRGAIFSSGPLREGESALVKLTEPENYTASILEKTSKPVLNTFLQKIVKIDTVKLSAVHE